MQEATSRFIVAAWVTPNTAPAVAEDVTRRRGRTLTQLQVSKEDEDAPLTSYKLARRRTGNHSAQNSLAHGCAQDGALVAQRCYFDSLDKTLLLPTTPQSAVPNPPPEPHPHPQTQFCLRITVILGISVF